MNLDIFVKQAYGLEVLRMEPLTDYGGQDVYRVLAEDGDYVLKQVPGMTLWPEAEGKLTAYLRRHGIKAPRMLRAAGGANTVAYDSAGDGYQLYGFFAGTIYAVSATPEEHLWESASLLGRIHATLREYPALPQGKGAIGLSKETLNATQTAYAETLRKAREVGDDTVTRDVEDRMDAFEMLGALDIDFDRLTIGNSHGDFRSRNLVWQEDGPAVINWEGAARVPLCREILHSYAYADPQCADGIIDPARLWKYLEAYQAHSPLTAYDLFAMPALYLYWLGASNPYEPYPCLSEVQRHTAMLCTRLIRHLVAHQRELGQALQELGGKV